MEQEPRLIPVAELPGTFDSTSWRAPYYMEFEQWEHVGEVLRVHRRKSEEEYSSRLWWLADWLNWGDGFFGERHAQALDQTDYAGESLNDIARVGRAFPFSQRQSPQKVTFWMHDEVVGLPETSRFALIARAANEGLTRRELRGIAAEERDKPDDGQGQLDVGDTTDSHRQKTCPLCEGAGMVSDDRHRAYLLEEGISP